MFDFGIELKYSWRTLIRILYPASCALCQTSLLIDEFHLCLLCKTRIPVLKDPLCLRCARPLAPFGTRNSVCSSCHSERPYFDRGFSLVEYHDSVKEIFHQIKFGKKIWLLSIFSELLNEAKPFNVSNYDMLIPIPLELSRERQRGFNQALEIAQVIKKTYETKPLEISKAIKKIKKTVPQSQLGRNKRLGNLTNAFRLKKTCNVRGKSVLLIDDIFTTGSTINECARLLKNQGAERVDFFTIARSISHEAS